MKLNGISLDCETNMALLSYLSGSQLKKQTIHECDFADTEWLISVWLTHYSSSQTLNLEEYNHKKWSLQEEIYDKGWELSSMMWYCISFQQGKLRQGGVVVDRDCILGFATSDTQESSLRSLKLLIIDETYNGSSNIDWSRKVHAYASENMVD